MFSEVTIMRADEALENPRIQVTSRARLRAALERDPNATIRVYLSQEAAARDAEPHHLSAWWLPAPLN